MRFLLNNLDWLAGVLELAGLYIIGNKNRWGFVVMVCGSVLWTYVGIAHGLYGLVLIAVTLGILNTWNWIKWRHRGKEV